MRVICLMHFASFCFLLYAVFFVKTTRFCVIFIPIIVQYLTIHLSLLLSTPSFSYHRQFPQSSGKKAGSRECARSFGKRLNYNFPTLLSTFYKNIPNTLHVYAFVGRVQLEMPQQAQVIKVGRLWFSLLWLGPRNFLIIRKNVWHCRKKH